MPEKSHLPIIQSDVQKQYIESILSVRQPETAAAEFLLTKEPALYARLNKLISPDFQQIRLELQQSNLIDAFEQNFSSFMYEMNFIPTSKGLVEIKSVDHIKLLSRVGLISLQDEKEALKSRILTIDRSLVSLFAAKCLTLIRNASYDKVLADLGSRRDFYKRGRQLIGLVVNFQQFELETARSSRSTVNLVYEHFNHALLFKLVQAIAMNFEQVLPHFDSAAELGSFLIMARMYGLLNPKNAEDEKKLSLIKYWSEYHPDPSKKTIFIRIISVFKTMTPWFNERHFRDADTLQLTLVKGQKSHVDQLANYQNRASQVNRASESSLINAEQKQGTVIKGLAAREGNIAKSKLEAAQVTLQVVKQRQKLAKDFTQMVPSLPVFIPDPEDAASAELLAKAKQEFALLIDRWVKENWQKILGLVEHRLSGGPAQSHYRRSVEARPFLEECSNLGFLLKDLGNYTFDFMLNGNQGQPDNKAARRGFHLEFNSTPAFVLAIINRAYQCSVEHTGLSQFRKQQYKKITDSFFTRYATDIASLHDKFVPPSYSTDDSDLAPTLPYIKDEYTHYSRIFSENYANVNIRDGILADSNQAVVQAALERKLALFKVIEPIMELVEQKNLTAMIEAVLFEDEKRPFRNNDLKAALPTFIHTIALGSSVLVASPMVEALVSSEQLPLATNDLQLLGMIGSLILGGTYIKRMADFSSSLPYFAQQRLRTGLLEKIREDSTNFATFSATRHIGPSDLIPVEAHAEVLGKVGLKSLSLNELASDERIHYFVVFLGMMLIIMMIGGASLYSETLPKAMTEGTSQADAGPLEQDFSSPMNSAEGISESRASIYIDYEGQNWPVFAQRQLCWLSELNTARATCGSLVGLEFLSQASPSYTLTSVSSDAEMNQLITERVSSGVLLSQRKLPGSSFFETLVGYEPIEVIILNNSANASFASVSYNPVMGTVVSGDFNNVAIIYQPLAARNMLPATGQPLPVGENDFGLDLTAPELEKAAPLVALVAQHLRDRASQISTLTQEDIIQQMEVPADQRGWYTNGELLDLQTNWFYEHGDRYGFSDFNGSLFVTGQDLFGALLASPIKDCEMISRARYYASRQASLESGEPFVVYEARGSALRSQSGWNGGDGHEVNFYLEVDGSLRVDASTLPAENEIPLPPFSNAGESYPVVREPYSKQVGEVGGQVTETAIAMIQNHREISLALSALLTVGVFSRIRYQKKRRKLADLAKKERLARMSPFGIALASENTSQFGVSVGDGSIDSGDDHSSTDKISDSQEIEPGIAKDRIDRLEEPKEEVSEAALPSEDNSLLEEETRQQPDLDNEVGTAVSEEMLRLQPKLAAAVEYMVLHDEKMLINQVVHLLSSLIEFAGSPDLENYISNLSIGWSGYYHHLVDNFVEAVESDSSVFEILDLSEQSNQNRVSELQEKIRLKFSPNNNAPLLSAILKPSLDRIFTLQAAEDASRDQAIFEALTIAKVRLEKLAQEYNPGEFRYNYDQALLETLELTPNLSGTPEEVAAALEARRPLELKLKKYRAVVAALQVINFTLAT